MKNRLVRVAILTSATLSVGAAPAAQVIPFRKYHESITVPAHSPVKFQRFDQYDRARFIGRFVLEGTFVLDCRYCEPGYKDNELSLSIVPDRSIAARLPHWKVHGDNMEIDITDAARFIRTISSPSERKRLLSGKLTEKSDIKGRAALVVDQFEAGLDCESANYSARFVAIATRAKRDQVAPDGGGGC
jgi:hypothetical protein